MSTPSTTSLQTFLETDLPACDFLLTLLSTAAFSPRFATFLTPTPHPSRYHNALQNEPHIAILRTDLTSLPPLHTLSTNPATLQTLSNHQISLLSHTFFRQDTQNTPWLISAPPGSTSPDHSFPTPTASTRTTTHHFHLPASSTPPATQPQISTAASEELIRAFHGSPPDRWYSILRNGLSVRPSIEVQNGRLYGDAIYLARSFRQATSFAPHTSVPKVAPIAGMSIVGHFDVHPRAPSDTLNLPDGYIVVQDPTAVSLVALSVLVNKAAGTARTGTPRERGTWLSFAFGKSPGLGFVYVLLIYLFVLWLISKF